MPRKIIPQTSATALPSGRFLPSYISGCGGSPQFSGNGVTDVVSADEMVEELDDVGDPGVSVGVTTGSEPMLEMSEAKSILADSCPQAGRLSALPSQNCSAPRISSFLRRESRLVRPGAVATFVAIPPTCDRSDDWNASSWSFHLELT